jgi:hypothetical protein
MYVIASEPSDAELSVLLYSVTPARQANQAIAIIDGIKITSTPSKKFKFCILCAPVPNESRHMDAV